MGRVEHVVGDGPGAGEAGGPEAHVVQLGAGEDGVDTLHRSGRRCVDVGDVGVGHGGADHAHPQLAGGVDVVDVATFTGEELGVLLAAHRGADDRFGCRVGGGHRLPPVDAQKSASFCAVERTDLTML